ncbi:MULTISPECIES: DICT sensory domain-containing protein [unclassified Halorhabdus]|uniref:DICT sensory domain-containing protein n=1 Tax=unclassified Halorhabdus TaxID=2621901 RepID=UPI0023DBC1D6|nr:MULTISPECIES: DICT sensory domain-containing protein [unclassified Halorhabdus]WEL18361.1 Putative sensor protein, containd DICT domain [Halorhabdus sp. SVX81]WEL22247.1 Putative sensor protein, containd DICT domain [Halorhabdus sp. BNX81]
MTLARIVEAIHDHEKELTLFNCDRDDPIADDLAEFFRTQNVRIRTAKTASGQPAEIAVLSDRDRVRSVVAVSTLRDLLDGVLPGADAVGIADGAYEPILEPLKETTFTAYDTEEMLYTSREIEDRARRMRDGTIHAGFQRLSLFAEQRSIYADLAARGVDVHAYGVPDTPPPDIDGAVHPIENDEIAETWFVVFDGGEQDGQKSALLAEERDEGSFYGIWTYDATIVDKILEHLEATYLFPDRAHPQSDS